MALKTQTQVLVVGAGPVGLFTALSLAERGVDVQIVDKEWRGSVHSYALALHPASLRMLDEHGAADELIQLGHRIERIAFYEGGERVGAVEIGDLDGAFSSVLVVPQSALENVLEQRLRQRKIKVLWNNQVLAIDQGPDKVMSRVALLEKYSVGYPVARTEWMTTKETSVQSSFLIGADGYHSAVRKAVGAQFDLRGDAEAFSVYEFPSKIDFQHEGRVVFHEGTTNVVWPLDARRGRWSFQVPHESPPEANMQTLREMVRTRAPWYDGEIGDAYWSTTALFERRLVDRFGAGRIWLAGDAAHVTGPVGAQSMNIGLVEAHDLAERISAVVKGAADLGSVARYHDGRQKEWESMLCGPKPTAGGAEWSGRQADRILPCLPASGSDLNSLLGQLGLELR